MTGPLIVVEDDADDQEIFAEIFKKLNVSNKIEFFSNGEEAYNYLISTHENPSIIISDINMPVMNGLEFREKINANEALKQKAIPFVFLTTASNPVTIKKAYDMTVQGFFQKEDNFTQLQSNFQLIISYWSKCKHFH